MNILMSVQGLSKAHGARPLFEGLTFGLFEGQRTGLIGPNGSGKSTLLSLLAGRDEPDQGDVVRRRGLRLGFLPQNDALADDRATAAEVLAAALGEAAGSAEERARLARAGLEAAGFPDPQIAVGSLSGGWRKRLAVLCAAGVDLDLLLLDEPTNHMDLEGVLWLERHLERRKGAVLMVTHDRAFLERICDRVIEINRVYPQGFFSVDGPYSRFLEQREGLLAAQAGRQASLANQVRGEIEWLRRGPKARGTKQQARIERAGGMIEELDAARRRGALAKTADLEFSGSERQTRRLVECFSVTKSMGGRRLFGPLDLRLGPGDALGLLGANGAGKSTLLKLLAGALEPDTGSVKQAPGLNVVAFDQHREALDPAWTLRRALADGNDSVVFRGRAQHVAGWAERFLFERGQLDRPLGTFSGGEQARVLIARLMLRPADLLLLDEPTNDLDLETLRVLEQGLKDFPGALVLVTHDRWLLESVGRKLLALDGQGGAEFYADLAQWEAHRAARPEGAGGTFAGPKTVRSAAAPRLSTRERRELEGMEGALAAAEAGVLRAQAALEEPSVASNAAALIERQNGLEAARLAVEALYRRWQELEDKRAQGA